MVFVETGAKLGRRAEAYSRTPSTLTDDLRPYRRKTSRLLSGAAFGAEDLGRRAESERADREQVESSEVLLAAQRIEPEPERGSGCCEEHDRENVDGAGHGGGSLAAPGSPAQREHDSPENRNADEDDERPYDRRSQLPVSKRAILPA